MTFWIEGRPNANHRPRFTGSGVVMDADYLTWRNTVGWAARLAQLPEYAGDVELCVIAYTASRNKQDVDNIAKGVLEGLEGIAYKDDRQVCRLVIEKHKPASRGEGCEVTVAGLNKE
jgi:crossover junction endodeoxyribonuclease RusA